MSFCVAAAALGASVSFCVAGAALGAPPERSAEVQQGLSSMSAGCFCVAGAALGGPQCH